MARVKTARTTRARHKKILKRAKGIIIVSVLIYVANSAMGG